jgi:predicted nuclease of predicted toxin-antitoxin system
MKLLLDECVPRKLKNNLIGHECQTVPEAGLAGKKNGELLSLAQAAGFEVFVTIDRGIEYEQNLVRRDIAVIMVRAKSSRLADLLPLVPEVLKQLPLGQERRTHPGGRLMEF